MSKELLQQVGQFIYGEQWQAPLAREISVGERSMRRWSAGTDHIPNGVWRDIGLQLETIQGDLEYLIGEVKKASGLVEVHSYKVWDQLAGDFAHPAAKSTAERIARIDGAEVILGSAEWVPPSTLDPEGHAREEEQKTTSTTQDVINRLQTVVADPQIPLFHTYLGFHSRFGFRGLPNTWARRAVLNPAAAWFKTNEGDALDLTFLIYQKDSGYPSVIDGQDSTKPTEHQKSRAREEAQKIIDKYRPGSNNPY
jgi:hypothetical protein